MTLPTKLSEMAEEYAKALAPESIEPWVETAYLKGAKAALALPEVQNLVTACSNASLEMNDKGYCDMTIIFEALTQWQSFTKGGGE